jgi:hypothetical protein
MWNVRCRGRVNEPAPLGSLSMRVAAEWGTTPPGNDATLWHVKFPLIGETPVCSMSRRERKAKYALRKLRPRDYLEPHRGMEPTARAELLSIQRQLRVFDLAATSASTKLCLGESCRREQRFLRFAAKQCLAVFPNVRTMLVGKYLRHCLRRIKTTKGCLAYGDLTPLDLRSSRLQCFRDANLAGSAGVNFVHI